MTAHARPEKMISRRNGVSLPAPDWPMTGGDGLGKAFRLARPRITRGEITEGYDLRGEKWVARRAQVWKIDTHPALATFPADQRVALTDYAEAVEIVAGSVKGQDFAAVGGGGAGGSRPPAPAALIAAETLRRCDAALLKHEGLTHVSNPVYGSRVVPRILSRVSLVDLVRAVVVDGMSRAEVVRHMTARLGIRTTGQPVQMIEARVAAALRDAAEIIAAEIAAPNATGRNRATKRGV